MRSGSLGESSGPQPRIQLSAVPLILVSSPMIVRTVLNTLFLRQQRCRLVAVLLGMDLTRGRHVTLFKGMPIMFHEVSYNMVLKSWNSSFNRLSALATHRPAVIDDSGNLHLIKSPSNRRQESLCLLSFRGRRSHD
jgi:hypothetical protein